MKGLEFLESLEKWNHKDKFDLSSISKVLDILGNPQNIPKSIHIAGTNGKGSVAYYLYNLLIREGYTVGLNTSPHLDRVNERFKLNGQDVSDEELDKQSLVLKRVLQDSGLKLTYHEAITVIAFLLFRDLEWIVIETGLGGRLDASNVLNKPELAIITSIAMDHGQILGDSLEKIAYEKAGIIKEQSTYCLGKLSQDTAKVIDDIGASRQARPLEYQYKVIGDLLQVSYAGELYEYLLTTSRSQAFASNIALVCLASLYLGFKQSNVQSTINEVIWPGRLESIVHRDIEFLLDSAHNPAGAMFLRDFLEKRDVKTPGAIFAAIQTKEWKEMLKPYLNFVVNWNIVESDLDVSVPAEEIKNFIHSHSPDCNIKVFKKDYLAAIEHSITYQKESRLLGQDKGFVVVFGSIYYLAKIRNIVLNA